MSATAKRVIPAAHSFDEVWSLPGDVVKRAPATEVVRGRLGSRVVFVKKYWTNSFRQKLSGALRGTMLGKSKVRREFENLHRLRGWGFDAPAPVAYGEERRARWLVRSFLVSEAVPDGVPLDACIASGDRQFLPRLADYLRRLHEHHFVHHDLYWRNIIVSGDHFYLLDAHKGGRGQRARDLAALDAPAPWFLRRTERLRFFLRYRQHDRLMRDDKKLIRQVLALAAPIRQRQLRRVREARR